jgi:hypothetical protein
MYQSRASEVRRAQLRGCFLRVRKSIASDELCDFFLDKNGDAGSVASAHARSAA